MTDDDCFYCDEPIGDEERVKGKFTDAHRRCVHAKLDKINPNWRDHVAVAPGGCNPASLRFCNQPEGERRDFSRHAVNNAKFARRSALWKADQLRRELAKRESTT